MRSKQRPDLLTAPCILSLVLYPESKTVPCLFSWCAQTLPKSHLNIIKILILDWANMLRCTSSCSKYCISRKKYHLNRLIQHQRRYYRLQGKCMLRINHQENIAHVVKRSKFYQGYTEHVQDYFITWHLPFWKKQDISKSKQLRAIYLIKRSCTSKALSSDWLSWKPPQCCDHSILLRSIPALAIS